MRFTVKQSEYRKKINIYLSVEVDDINPLEIEEDLKEIKQFLLDKYANKTNPNSVWEKFKKNFIK